MLHTRTRARRAKRFRSYETTHTHTGPADSPLRCSSSSSTRGEQTRIYTGGCFSRAICSTSESLARLEAAGRGFIGDAAAKRRVKARQVPTTSLGFAALLFLAITTARFHRDAGRTRAIKHRSRPPVYMYIHIYMIVVYLYVVYIRSPVRGKIRSRRRAFDTRRDRLFHDTRARPISGTLLCARKPVKIRLRTRRSLGRTYLGSIAEEMFWRTLFRSSVYWIFQNNDKRRSLTTIKFYNL